MSSNPWTRLLVVGASILGGSGVVADAPAEASAGPGAVSLATPFAGLALMVLKPAL